MSTIDNTTIIITAAQALANTVSLYFYSPLLAFSTLCYLFIFYHLLFTRAIRRPLNNHVIILLLIAFFIQAVFDTPLHFDYFRRGFYWPPSLIYCFVLYMLDYVVYLIGAFLTVWGSFERHILIFNPTVFNTRARRIIGHYIPMSFCIIYPIIYYTYFILFYPCNSYYDMDARSCVAACFLWTSNFMAFYELLVNGFVPVCLVAMFSTSLLVRIVWQKQQMGRQMTWRKNRKMAVQLLGISTSFLVFNIGYFVIAIGQMVYDPTFGANLMPWFLSVNLCTLQMVLPFLCLGTIPHLRQKLKAMNPWGHRAAVQPTSHLRTGTIPMNRRG